MSSVVDDYDHHDHVGNRGGVVKHVALIAAIDAVLNNVTDQVMRYADLFAGYPSSTLTAESRDGDGWGGGVGRLVATRAKFAENPHVNWWANRYLTVNGCHAALNMCPCHHR